MPAIARVRPGTNLGAQNSRPSSPTYMAEAQYLSYHPASQNMHYQDTGLEAEELKLNLGI